MRCYCLVVFACDTLILVSPCFFLALISGGAALTAFQTFLLANWPVLELMFLFGFFGGFRALFAVVIFFLLPVRSMIFALHKSVNQKPDEVAQI